MPFFNSPLEKPASLPAGRQAPWAKKQSLPYDKKYLAPFYFSYELIIDISYFWIKV